MSTSYAALYDHQPEVLENIKRESLSILNDSMVQRGLPKVQIIITIYCVVRGTMYECGQQDVYIPVI